MWTGDLVSYARHEPWDYFDGRRKEAEGTEENKRHRAFVKAASLGDLKTVKAMLQEDNPVDVDCLYHTECGELSALYEASNRGNVAMVKALLQAGANVNLQCRRKWTALHAACDGSRNIEVIQELLKAGADVNMRSQHGEIPLLLLEDLRLYYLGPFTMGPKPVDERPKLMKIARMLLEAKCDVNQKTDMGETAISRARNSGLQELVPLFVKYGGIISQDTFLHLEKESLDNAAFLIQHGLNINKQDYKGFTALHFAAADGKVDTVQLLLDHNADVSLLDNTRKRTALMTAILGNVKHYYESSRPQKNSLKAKNQLLIVHLLLKRMALTDKFLIDHQDFEGHTALHLAAAQVGCRPLVQEILHWGPNLLLRSDRSNEAALHRTLSEYQRDDNGRYDQLETFKCLFEHTNGYSNADYSNLQDKYGRTVLHEAVGYAIRNSFSAFMEYLSGVVDVRVQDANGKTVLHMAVQDGLSVDHLRVLLRGRHGMDAANVLNNQGRTALMEAVIKRNTSAVMALYPITEIDISDLEGKTALHHAIEMKESEYVDILIKHDANILLRDNEGNTALALACCLNDYDGKTNLQLSIIFQLYRYGVGYGEQLNMI